MSDVKETKGEENDLNQYIDEQSKSNKSKIFYFNHLIF